MRFVDEATIWVQSGDGGKGCLSFRREKYVPRGGPDGGNGGRGGDIILIATNKHLTLLDHSYQQHYKAQRGQHGKGKLQHGKNGRDLEILVPLGTVVRDAESHTILKDLTREGERFVVVNGGRGGRGNASFKSSINRAPKQVQPGEEGIKKQLKLELKLLADVGIVGLPNAGKSTLISKISSAQPRIADYPFTTLTPNLGVVNFENLETFVVADIPGLIKGAHQGAGLGLKFLRHIERTSILMFLLDLSRMDIQDPGKDYRIIINEFKNYDSRLLEKPQILALNKLDLLSSKSLPAELESYYRKLRIPFVAISALTGEGIDSLLKLIKSILAK
ncbi:MAG: GTPase ObgE [Deltaproteobacteria bacterium]|nr:GTPase ObgE [Deltaproteobacteria bacterium]